MLNVIDLPGNIDRAHDQDDGENKLKNNQGLPEEDGICSEFHRSLQYLYGFE